MAEIVNLRLARKARRRVGKEAAAAANRAKFGQSRAELEVRRIETERAEQALDGAKRDKD